MYTFTKVYIGEGQRGLRGSCAELKSYYAEVGGWAPETKSGPL